MDDPLDAALAAEEHRHGMRYGDDPSHCDACLRAGCRHDGRRADVTRIDSARLQWLCQQCRQVIEEER